VSALRQQIIEAALVDIFNGINEVPALHLKKGNLLPQRLS
jgi:hypothetical protein